MNDSYTPTPAPEPSPAYGKPAKKAKPAMIKYEWFLTQLPEGQSKDGYYPVDQKDLALATLYGTQRIVSHDEEMSPSTRDLILRRLDFLEQMIVSMD